MAGYNDMTNAEKLKMNLLEKKYVSGIFDDDTLELMVDKWTNANGYFNLNLASAEGILMKAKVSSLKIGDLQFDNSIMKEFWANLHQHYLNLANADSRNSTSGGLRIGRLLSPMMNTPYEEEEV